MGCKSSVSAQNERRGVTFRIATAQRSHHANFVGHQHLKREALSHQFTVDALDLDLMRGVSWSGTGSSRRSDADRYSSLDAAAAVAPISPDNPFFSISEKAPMLPTTHFCSLPTNFERSRWNFTEGRLSCLQLRHESGSIASCVRCSVCKMCSTHIAVCEVNFLPHQGSGDPSSAPMSCTLIPGVSMLREVALFVNRQHPVTPSRRSVTLLALHCMLRRFGFRLTTPIALFILSRVFLALQVLLWSSIEYQRCIAVLDAANILLIVDDSSVAVKIVLVDADNASPVEHRCSFVSLAQVFPQFAELLCVPPAQHNAFPPLLLPEFWLTFATSKAALFTHSPAVRSATSTIIQVAADLLHQRPSLKARC